MTTCEYHGSLVVRLNHGRQELFVVFLSAFWNLQFDGLAHADCDKLVGGERSSLIKETSVQFSSDWHSVWFRAENVQLHERHQTVVHGQS